MTAAIVQAMRSSQGWPSGGDPSTGHQNEAMTVHAQHYWANRFAADAAQLEQRRQAGLKQAQAAADALRLAWPEVRAIHLFGSILDERFRDHSDLDLLVDGLPASDLLDAIALAEAAGPLPVDLKRREDFSADLGDRLLRHSRLL